MQEKKEIDVEITEGKSSRWIPAELLTMVGFLPCVCVVKAIEHSD